MQNQHSLLWELQRKIHNIMLHDQSLKALHDKNWCQCYWLVVIDIMQHTETVGGMVV